MQEELLQVSFLGIYETTKLSDNFWHLHCYGVTLVKKCNKPLLQISETKIFNQIKYKKRLAQIKQGKQFGSFGNKSDYG